MNSYNYKIRQAFKVSKLLLIVSITLTVSNMDAQSIKFHNTTQQNIERISDTANKPYFIYLYEHGNFDCHKMESFTFSDKQLVDIINQNLIANKIDGNSTEGLNLKESYNIGLLPALLFFDENEELKLQQEVAMGSVSFLKILSMLYDLQFDEIESVSAQQQFDNARKISVNVATQYASVEELDLKESERAPIAKNNVRPISQIEEEPESNDIIATIDKVIAEEILPPSTTISSTPVEAAMASKTKAVEPNVVSNPKSKTPTATPSSKSLADTNLTKSESLISDNRIIQLGAFNKYVDVVDQMIKLQSKLEMDLSIIEEYTMGKLYYKLVSTKQHSKPDASELAQKLKGKGIECFVRKAK